MAAGSRLPSSRERSKTTASRRCWWEAARTCRSPREIERALERTTDPEPDGYGSADAGRDRCAPAGRSFRTIRARCILPPPSASG